MSVRVRVLARSRNNHSNLRFRQEAAKQKVRLLVTDPNEYEIVLGRKTPLLFRGGRKQDKVDVVIPRTGASVTNYALAVLGQYEMMGVPTVNSVSSIVRTRNKLRCIQLLSRYDIDIPRTVVVRKPGDISLAVEMVGGFPVILKLLSGTQGVGVMLAESRAMIESTLDTLWRLGQDILVQECIRESLGRDIRVVVVGGEVVAAMRRQARIGEFRSNIHRGGVGTSVELTGEYDRVARQAAKIVGLDVAGVDLLESDAGPKVIEVNSAPGMEGVEQATGINVAGKILELAIEKAKRHQRRYHGE